jgi:uncharacterized membrane protein YbhN (UPF0104 family)
MKRWLELVWPLIGVVAVVAAIFLLHRQFRGEAVPAQVWANIRSIPPGQFALAILATLIAYAALAWYDRIALLHLGVKHISWTFVALCSFTTYALAHNIGASVLSGAMVRYRAYRTKGLTPAEITILVGLCSLTFGLGVLLIGGLILVIDPRQLHRLSGLLPHVLTHAATARAIGIASLSLVVAYAAGSIFKLPPFRFGTFRVDYPRPGIAARQFLAASMELIGAAAIIYFALPREGSPTFFAVLTVFVASFSAALASNAPGGLGVFELLFIKAMPAVAPIKVLTALLVFRLFYLLLPLAFAVVIIVIFERRQLTEALSHNQATPEPAREGADLRERNGQKAGV